MRSQPQIGDGLTWRCRDLGMQRRKDAKTRIFSTNWTVLHSQNPNGIPSPSPGLRAPRYPGKRPHRMINPNGVVSSCLNLISISCLSFVPFRSTFCNNARHSSGHNPVGVEMFIRTFPRVARQPWAVGRNPVGILGRNAQRRQETIHWTFSAPVLEISNIFRLTGSVRLRIKT
jgi:hypothetical protein